MVVLTPCEQHARSIAMFSASMALSFSTTIVVFSPSARGSRSLLERMHDFVRVLGAEKRVLSYNQENLRVRALDGGVSLLRSFPSKIEVCAVLRTTQDILPKNALLNTPLDTPLDTHIHTHTHTRREEDPSIRRSVDDFTTSGVSILFLRRPFEPFTVSVAYYLPRNLPDTPKAYALCRIGCASRTRRVRAVACSMACP